MIGNHVNLQMLLGVNALAKRAAPSKQTVGACQGCELLSQRGTPGRCCCQAPARAEEWRARVKPPGPPSHAFLESYATGADRDRLLDGGECHDRHQEESCR